MHPLARGALGAAALLAAAVQPATAHVSLDLAEAAPGAYVRAALRVAHGCGSAATTAVRVDLPPDITAAQPMPKAGWTVEIVRGGNAVRALVWSGGSLPNEQYDEFVFRARVAPGTVPGTPLALPVTQSCGATEVRWSEVPAAGASGDLRLPAPLLRVAGEAGAGASRAAILVDQAWTRATARGAPVGGGYLRLTNTGPNADTLVGGTLPGVAGRVEVHEMATVEGVMRMRRLEPGLRIAAGQTVDLTPGGTHLMLLDLSAPLADGQRVRGTLQFERAGSVQVEYVVRPFGATDAGPRTDEHRQH